VITLGALLATGCGGTAGTEGEGAPAVAPEPTATTGVEQPAQDAGPAQGAEPTRLTEADAGKTVSLPVGAVLVVALEGNPTTGYTWEKVAGDAAVLSESGESTFAPVSEAPGSGGTRTFTFEAVATGRTPLKLVQHRSWEEGVDPLQTFEVEVAVE